MDIGKYNISSVEPYGIVKDKSGGTYYLLQPMDLNSVEYSSKYCYAVTSCIPEEVTTFEDDGVLKTLYIYANPQYMILKDAQNIQLYKLGQIWVRGDLNLLDEPDTKEETELVIQRDDDPYTDYYSDMDDYQYSYSYTNHDEMKQWEAYRVGKHYEFPATLEEN